MSFSVAAPGGFSFGERLPSSWANTVDADHANAIDGTGGGSYNPSAPIIIGGAGLQVGNFTTSGDTTIGSDASDDLDVQATAVFNNGVTFAQITDVLGPSQFSGAVSLNGDSAIGNSSSDDCTVNATLDIRNGCTIGSSGSDSLTVNSSTIFNGSIEFAGGATFTGAITFENDVTMGTNASDLIDIIGRVRIGRQLEYQNAGSGIGRVPYRAPLLLDAAGETVGVADGDVFQIPTDATDDYTLSTTGAVDGDRAIFFTSGNIDNNTTIHAGAATAVLTAGDRWSIEYVFFGAGWKILHMVTMG